MDQPQPAITHSQTAVVMSDVSTVVIPLGFAVVLGSTAPGFNGGGRWYLVVWVGLGGTSLSDESLFQWTLSRRHTWLVE